MASFKVKRAHWGDKDGKRHRYQRDEVREAEPGEVAGLVKAEALEAHLPQLDHDGDGSPGGSKPKKTTSTDAAGDLAAEGAGKD